MEISARNKLPGKITKIVNGLVTSKVEVDVAGSTLVAVITKDSVEELGLKEGDSVKALIKATSIMIMK